MCITFAPETEFENHQVGELEVGFGKVTGVERACSTCHVVYLLGTDIVAQGRYGGSLVKPVHWRAGEIGFKPKLAEWDCQPSCRHEATIIGVPDHLLAGLPANASLNTAQLPFERIQNSALAHLGHSLRALASDRSTPPDRMITDSLSTAFAAALVRQMVPDADLHLSVGHGLSDARRRLVLDYIEENLGKPISLSELAGLAALSTFHFSRSFKAALGTSPLRYVTQRRIERAKHKLSRTDEPIAMIALSCGFGSQSHFTDAFRKATGKTPATFRGARRLAVVAAVMTLLPRASAYSSAAMMALA